MYIQRQLHTFKTKVIIIHITWYSSSGGTLAQGQPTKCTSTFLAIHALTGGISIQYRPQLLYFSLLYPRSRQKKKIHSLSLSPHKVPNTDTSTYHLQLHVVVTGVNGHTGCSGENAIQESIIGETALVLRANIPTVQNLHHSSTNQWHHQSTGHTQSFTFLQH